MERLPTLTPNARRLVLKLAELPLGWVTAATLAQALVISRRTVLRELPVVEDWMNAAGFHFERSPGQGLLLDEPAERRAALSALAASGQQYDAPLPAERRQRLLRTLLAADTPLKSGLLAEELLVSDHTLAGDLTRLESWLQPYHITLCRRPGVGIWLEAGPEDRRRAAGALLRISLPEQSLRAYFEGAKQPPTDPPSPALLDPATAKTVWQILREFEQAEGLQFTDAGFLALAVHCVLTVQQLRAGRWGLTAEEHPVSLGLAKRLAARLDAALACKLPPAEVHYLAEYLDAYGGQATQPDPLAADALAVRSLAAELIRAMEREMPCTFADPSALAESLCCHLRPMLYRMEQGVPAENPQLELLQTQYAALWQATRAACDAVRPGISDAEAGFLAMHFGAAIEQEAVARLRVRAVVVCPYGMASSRFLASQLLREFPQLDIAEIGSARALDAAQLRSAGVDLVISTVPLSLDFPQVCVNAILQQQDRTRVLAAIDAARHAPLPRPQPAPQPELRYAGDLSAALLDLLDHLTIETVPIARNRAGLIAAAARLFCPRPADARNVEQVLLRRESLGDTYMKPLCAVLLHGRTPAVLGCRLGYLIADPPVYEQGHMVRGALVLLAPAGPEDLPLQVMQAVSAQLIEDPALMDALRAADRDSAARVLEQGLTRRFRQVLGR